MEQIRSRKNQYILHLRALARDKDVRRDAGEYVCDGEKLLREALQFGAEVTSVLWRDAAAFPLPDGAAQYTADAELVAYASPLMHSPGPVFTVRLPEMRLPQPLRHGHAEQHRVFQNRKRFVDDIKHRRRAGAGRAPRELIEHGGQKDDHQNHRLARQTGKPRPAAQRAALALRAFAQQRNAHAAQIIQHHQQHKQPNRRRHARQKPGRSACRGCNPFYRLFHLPSPLSRGEKSVCMQENTRSSRLYRQKPFFPRSGYASGRVRVTRAQKNLAPSGKMQYDKG